MEKLAESKLKTNNCEAEMRKSKAESLEIAKRCKQKLYFCWFLLIFLLILEELEYWGGGTTTIR